MIVIMWLMYVFKLVNLISVFFELRWCVDRGFDNYIEFSYYQFEVVSM